MVSLCAAPYWNDRLELARRVQVLAQGMRGGTVNGNQAEENTCD